MGIIYFYLFAHNIYFLLYSNLLVKFELFTFVAYIFFLIPQLLTLFLYKRIKYIKTVNVERYNVAVSISLLFYLIYLILITDYDAFSPFNRMTRETEFYNSTLNAYIGIIFKVALSFFIINQVINKRRVFNFFVYLAIIYFIFELLYLGARRNSLFVITCVVFSYLTYSDKTLRLYPLAIISFIVLIFFGSFREILNIGHTENFNFSEILSNGFDDNEFSYVSNYIIRYLDVFHSLTFDEILTNIKRLILFVPGARTVFSLNTVPSHYGFYPNLIGELIVYASYFSGLIIGIIISATIIMYRRNVIFGIISIAISFEMYRTSLPEYVTTLAIAYFVILFLFVFTKRNSFYSSLSNA